LILFKDLYTITFNLVKSRQLRQLARRYMSLFLRRGTLTSSDFFFFNLKKQFVFVSLFLRFPCFIFTKFYDI